MFLGYDLLLSQLKDLFDDTTGTKFDPFILGCDNSFCLSESILNRLFKL